MARLVEEYADAVMSYDCILATGHTAKVATKELLAAGQSKREVLKKICACKSGPEGGDVQIAAAVVRGYCRDVIFLQDPKESHPHSSDIHLFEQAILTGVEVGLATNVATAKMLLRARRGPVSMQMNPPLQFAGGQP